MEKLIPYKLVSFRQTADITVGKDGSIEKRDKQWAGGTEDYELEDDAAERLAEKLRALVVLEGLYRAREDERGVAAVVMRRSELACRQVDVRLLRLAADAK